MTEGQSIGHTEAMFPGARLYFGHHCKPEQPVSFHEVRFTGGGGVRGDGENQWSFLVQCRTTHPQAVPLVLVHRVLKSSLDWLRTGEAAEGR